MRSKIVYANAFNENRLFLTIPLLIHM